MAEDNKNTKNEANSGDNSDRVGKHLTDMKELPDYADNKNSSPATGVGKKQDNPAQGSSQGPKEASPQVKRKKPGSKFMKGRKPSEKGDEAGNGTGDSPSPKRGIPLTTKDIILGVINLVSIILLIILLVRLPQKADRLKELRNEDIRNQASLSFDLADISDSSAKADELEELFIDESGVVEFVNDVEGLRSEESSITEVRFTSQEAVKDKTGNYGIPIIIELRGSWQQIGQDLQEIQKLPYLFRAVKIEVEPLEDEGSLIQFRYGGLLYVDDKLGED